MKNKKLSKENENIRILNVLLETACAEFGSALEMLIACKGADSINIANGYFQHAKDEYNHTHTFLSILSKYGKNSPTKISRKYRFNTNSVITKGYVSTDGYLIETMSIKDFIAYVYTNELLAKESFDGILKLLRPHSDEGIQISKIMDDELRHHGLAEKYFLKYYPRLQPWQLMCYRLRETIMNRGRKFYDKNLKFLDKVLTPLYFFIAYLVGKVLKFVDMNEFDRKGKNLMDIKCKSVI